MSAHQRGTGTAASSPSPSVGSGRLSSRPVLAWASWDWGSAAFNAVMTTFVFTVYLTSDAFGGEARASQVLGWGLAAAGLLIALLAPVTGQRSDTGGRRRLWLGVNSLLVAVLTGLCFFVFPSPEMLFLGVALIAVANIFFEFANVNYNAMLTQISTPSSIGRVSGFGWAMGYLGGIVALLVVLVAFVEPVVDWPGASSDNGLNIRLVAVFSALWFAAFALPVLFAVPEVPRRPDAPRPGILASYALLVRRVRTIHRESPHTIYFLLASAVFRDGLAAVFTFGGVLAAGAFGFSTSQVIVFAIVANVTAASGAVVGGFLDDRVGPKRVIIGSLLGLLVAGTAILVLGTRSYEVFGRDWTSDTTFWVFGLLLTLFVGPAQASSRAYLARLAPPGGEGEIFGLYATTGRAVSFLAPALFALSITVFGSQLSGVVGILVVLLAGLLLLLPVRPPAVGHASASTG
ncbi:membrane protein [Arthrobacter sp. RIT-PI-e]|uniref:MFS transporter n=1 Tax=Arthrobacter sp. RIT-PI-e TaxID=1681197 RepID=UPI0006765679|nr:MFS transporter [Arthrobacter sp. RIT-PI-e]KNC18453.1 membrane protein [Arthrobacter sp. RIT-PI-e]